MIRKELGPSIFKGSVWASALNSDHPQRERAKISLGGGGEGVAR